MMTDKPLRVGRSSGLDYEDDVLVEDGLLTCEVHGRLPGYYEHLGEAKEQAQRHLGRKHKMCLY